MKSYRELRTKLHKDEELIALRNLHKALRHGDRVMQRMREREEEIFQQYISGPTLVDLAQEAFGTVRANEQTAICECNTSNHAHSINCPQHPVNLQPAVKFK